MRIMRYCCEVMVEMVQSGAIRKPYANIDGKCHYIYAHPENGGEPIEVLLYYCLNCGAELPTENEKILAVEI